MTSRSRRVAVCVGILVVVAAATLLPSAENGVAVDIAIGLFGAFLTAIAVVMALIVDVNARWPSLTDVVAQTYLVPWFVLSLAAVLLAATGAAEDLEPLLTPSVVLSVVAALLGTFTIRKLLLLSGGESRTTLLSRLLLRDIAEASDPAALRTGQAEMPFLTVVSLALDAGSSTELRERVDEMKRATADAPDELLPKALELELEMVEALGRATLNGRTGSAIAGDLVSDLLDDLATKSGRLLSIDADRARCERQAAAFMGQAARLGAWLSLCARYRFARDEGYDRAALTALDSGVERARWKIVHHVDPDPPGVFIPAHDPWEPGLSDAEAAMSWLWAWSDFGAPQLARGLYVLVEVLTGEKFYGAASVGCVFSEIEDRMSGAGGGAGSADLLERVGGLEAASLELFVNTLATWPDADLCVPGGAGTMSGREMHPLNYSRLIRYFSLREDRRLGVDDALEQLARLTGAGRAPDTLFGLVRNAYGSLDRVFPPMCASDRRPGASVLAVGFRVGPLESSGSTANLERYLRRLPPPLLEAALAHARETLPEGDFDSADAISEGSRVEELISRMGVVTVVDDRLAATGGERE